VLLVNEAEARELAGEANLVKAARAIRRMGPRYLVVKRGEYGALLFYDREGEPHVFYAPAYPLEDVFDPTGAGDSFAGGFIGWLARCGRDDGDALRQALACGTAMASLAIEDFSPRRLLETDREEIARRVGLLHRMTSFDLEPVF